MTELLSCVLDSLRPHGLRAARLPLALGLSGREPWGGYSFPSRPRDRTRGSPVSPALGTQVLHHLCHREQKSVQFFAFFKAPPASRAAPELDLALPANSEGEPRPCLPVRSRLADAVAALSVSGAAFPRSQNLRPAHLLPDLFTRVFLF